MVGEEHDNPFLSTGTPANVDRITSNSDDAKRFLESFALSPHDSPIPDTPIPQRTAPPKRLLLLDPSSPVPVISAKAKGKQKAADLGDEYEEDNSQVVRVRGKERELREAQEDHLRREQERGDDPETTLIFEDRERDRDRIKELEAEVAALRQQASSFHIALPASIECGTACRATGFQRGRPISCCCYCCSSPTAPTTSTTANHSSIWSRAHNGCWHP